ncbi:hypothetical protein FRACYDRAFT_248636 [Fragilariopsis cylindrus CCMP1102]|uniref:Uncharacterized protein n=1 Tax=Fragilariopsis cylindrus CCMP1102 TaxID=635003 RepID=A0A1E7ETV8_9STRA|nr:hypothetical protein FRACYDRAFT_248636 [Fragilariopsis cylindrus CCMP1102]|eukprot:OEU09296.1 hypothetical protein FRACYDRAFT_248636 [Fragilariopsis cylindrus CCMP1102]
MSASCGILLGSLMKQVPDFFMTTMKLWMGCLESFFQPATTTTTTTSNDSSNTSDNNNSSAEGNSNNSGYESDQPITTTVTNSCTRENVMKDDAIASEDNSIPIPISILLATTINTAIATGKKMDEEGRNLSSTTSTYDNTIESIRAILDLDIVGGVNWKWIANMMSDSDVLACNILRRNNNSPSIKSTFTTFKSKQMIHPTAYLIKTLGLSLKLNILCTKTRTEIQSLSDETERINDLWTTNLEDNKTLTAKLWIRRARSNTSRASALMASDDILLKLMELNFVCNSGLFHARIMNENNNDNGDGDGDDDNGDDGGGERRALITVSKINAYHEINKELTSEIQESIKHADEITKQMVHSEYDKCSNCNTMYHKDSWILFGSIIQKYNEGSSTSSVFLCFQCTDDPEQKVVQVGCGEMLQVLEEDRLSSNPTSSGNNTKKKSNRKKKKKRRKKLTHINNNDDTAGPLDKIRGPPNAVSSPSSVLLFPHPLPGPRFFCSTTTTSNDGGNDDDDNDTGSSDSKTFILRDDETEDNSLGSSWSARGDIIASDYHQTTTSATKKGTALVLNDDLVDYLLQTGSIIALNDYMNMLGLDNNDDDTENDNFGDCDDLKEV